MLKLFLVSDPKRPSPPAIALAKTKIRSGRFEITWRGRI